MQEHTVPVNGQPKMERKRNYCLPFHLPPSKTYRPQILKTFSLYSTVLFPAFFSLPPTHEQNLDQCKKFSVSLNSAHPLFLLNVVQKREKDQKNCIYPFLFFFFFFSVFLCSPLTTFRRPIPFQNDLDRKKKN